MDSAIALFIAALEPLRVLALKVYAFVPSVAFGLLLLLLGAFLAVFMRGIVERVLDMIRLDEHVKQIGVPDILRRLGLGGSLTRLSGIVVYSMIILAFIVSAANAVGLTVVMDFLREVARFMPTLIAVLIVMGGGLFLGNIAGHIVHNAATANRIRGAEALSRLAYGLMILFSGLMSLRLLGVDLSILNSSIRIILGSIGLGFALAFGIAFGMAGRDTAAKLIRDLTPRHGRGDNNGRVRFKRAA